MLITEFQEAEKQLKDLVEPFTDFSSLCVGSTPRMGREHTEILKESLLKMKAVISSIPGDGEQAIKIAWMKINAMDQLRVVGLFAREVMEPYEKEYPASYPGEVEALMWEAVKKLKSIIRPWLADANHSNGGDTPSSG